MNNKFTYISLYMVLAMFLLHCTLLAQETISKSEEFTLAGTVINSETRKPIPHVEVFISGTTRGCISDMLGNFTLEVPYIPCTLVADHVSYESFVTPIVSNIENLEITLKPSNFSIEVVKISGKDKRKENLRYFYSYFIRKNKNKFEVLNDSVLYFKSDKKEFVAYSNEPLIIINKKLGYKTKITIERFQIIRTEYPNGPLINLNSTKGTERMELKGHFYYAELLPKSIKERLAYLENRRLRYFGSERHLLKAVYHNDTYIQSFSLEVFPESKNLEGFKRVEDFDTAHLGMNYKLDCDSILVTYQFGKYRFPYNYRTYYKTKAPNIETSTIYGSNQIFTIRNNGTSSNISFTIKGPLTSTDNVVNTLPLDYDPFL